MQRHRISTSNTTCTTERSRTWISRLIGEIIIISPILMIRTFKSTDFLDWCHDIYFWFYTTQTRSKKILCFYRIPHITPWHNSTLTSGLSQPMFFWRVTTCMSPAITILTRTVISARRGFISDICSALTSSMLARMRYNFNLLHSSPTTFLVDSPNRVVLSCV